MSMFGENSKSSLLNNCFPQPTLTSVPAVGTVVTAPGSIATAKSYISSGRPELL